MRYFNSLSLLVSNDIKEIKSAQPSEMETRRNMEDQLEHYKKQTLLKQLILKNRYEQQVV